MEKVNMSMKASATGDTLALDVHNDAPDLTRCNDLLSQQVVIFAPTRTGMGVGPILPQVLDLKRTK